MNSTGFAVSAAAIICCLALLAWLVRQLVHEPGTRGRPRGDSGWPELDAWDRHVVLPSTQRAWRPEPLVPWEDPYAPGPAVPDEGPAAGTGSTAGDGPEAAPDYVAAILAAPWTPGGGLDYESAFTRADAQQVRETLAAVSDG